MELQGSYIAAASPTQLMFDLVYFLQLQGRGRGLVKEYLAVVFTKPD